MKQHITVPKSIKEKRKKTSFSTIIDPLLKEIIGESIFKHFVKSNNKPI